MGENHILSPDIGGKFFRLVYQMQLWLYFFLSVSQWELHLNRIMTSIYKILPTLLEVFLRHLSYYHWKTFNEAYYKINEFSNFKYNLVSQFNKLQDTATELGSKSASLRTWKSLLNYDQSINIKFSWFFSLCNAWE